MSRWQAIHGWLFRKVVSAMRALRPRHWPIIGPAIAPLAERLLDRTHPDVVSTDGHELRLDPSDDLGLARGRARGYEPLLHEVMERHIPGGGTVIDGGAHIGYHTLLAARLVGPTGHVIAFEPSPTTYPLLLENVERNGYRNVTPMNAALADRSGRGTLYLCATNNADHRISELSERDAVEVELHSLDAFVPENQPVDFVKLDVQGAEPLVLRGGRRVLERNPQLVMAFEYAPFVMPAELTPEAFLDEVFSSFAQVFEVNDDANSISPAIRERLLATYTRENERYTNLLCLNR
jgi:FkbM family methyltransferase